MRALSWPRPRTIGDVGFWIQRGATIQTQRLLADSSACVLAVAAQAIDTLIAIPFVVSLGAMLDQINLNVTAAAAGSSARVGIYRATSPRNLYPGALVSGTDAGAIDTTTVGYKTSAVTATLKPWLYWAVYTAGVLAPTVNTIPNVATNAHCTEILGWTAANPPASFNSLRVARAFAALPATFPAGAALNAGPATALFGRFSA